MPLRMIFTIIFKSNHVDACARFISYRGPIGLGSAAPDTGWPPPSSPGGCVPQLFEPPGD